MVIFYPEKRDLLNFVRNRAVQITVIITDLQQQVQINLCCGDCD